LRAETARKGFITIPKQTDVVGRDSGANRLESSWVVKTSSWVLRTGLPGDLDPIASGPRHLFEALSKSSLLIVSDWGLSLQSSLRSYLRAVQVYARLDSLEGFSGPLQRTICGGRDVTAALEGCHQRET